MNRKIDSKSAITNRSRIPSAKNGRLILVESMLERDMALRLEFAPRVQSFKEQPHTFEFLIDGKVVHATPDFAVGWDAEDTEYIEVKPASKAREEKTAKRLSAIKQHIEAEGFSYAVMTEKEIRSSNQVLQNCMYLNPFKWRSRVRLEDFRSQVPSEPIPFCDWAEKIEDAQAVVEMMAHQLVFFDFYQRITPYTLIRPIEDGDFGFMYA